MNKKNVLNGGHVRVVCVCAGVCAQLILVLAQCQPASLSLPTKLG